MIKKFIAAKGFMELEIVVDGDINVKPKAPFKYDEKVHQVLAKTHQLIFQKCTFGTHGTHEKSSFVVNYLQSKGWAVRELQTA